MTRNHSLAIAASGVALVGSGLAVLDVHSALLGIPIIIAALFCFGFVLHQWRKIGRVAVGLHENSYKGTYEGIAYYMITIEFSHSGDAGHALKNPHLEHKDHEVCSHYYLPKLRISGNDVIIWEVGIGQTKSPAAETLLLDEIFNMPPGTRTWRKKIWMADNNPNEPNPCQSVVFAIDDVDGNTWRSPVYIPGGSIVHMRWRDVFGKS